MKFIYKGLIDTPENAQIDSMFFGQFADTDIGGAADDFSGCDTTLQLGYGYNSTTIDGQFQKFDLPTPAFGYSLFHGPLVKSKNPSKIGIFDFKRRDGHTNLKMTSFWLHATGGPNGAPTGNNYINTLRLYHLLNGYYSYTHPDLNPVIDAFGNPTKFILYGDPVKGTGWIDGMFDGSSFGYGSPFPGERYFTMNTGPFTMVLGDTQDVVISMVGGLGADHLASVSVMKYYTQYARQMEDYDYEIGFASEPVVENSQRTPQNYHLYQNFPNPFKLNTTIRYYLPVQQNVKLTIYNSIGQEIITLVNNIQYSSFYSYEWNGKDVNWQQVPNGIYIYKISMGKFVFNKMIFLE